MRSLLKYLHVDELIVHDIPKRLSKRFLRGNDEIEEETPIYSEVASPVSTSIINFFHDRISGTIGSIYALDITFNPLSKTPIKRLVSDYFISNTNERIRITKEITQYLYEIQNASNSSGLLLFVRCLIKEQVSLAILKVEREEGVRIKQQIVKDGLKTFNVEHIKDLMLTKKTKLFKIVLFYIKDDKVKGILCDQQKGNKDKYAADFFLSDFLGCTLIDEPQIITKNYYEATERYINEKVTSPEQKGILINHLISDLTDQNDFISPTNFAKRALEVEKRDEYLQYLKDSGVVTGNFKKENSLIENKIKKVQYNFSSGIFVLGSKEAMLSKSKATDMENGEMKMIITDVLERVKAK